MTDLETTRPQTLFNVLLIGDSCTDRYIIGTVDRLSPEAPVPVIKLVESTDVPGMASNVHLNLKNLGIDADLICNANEIIKSRYIDQRSGQHLLRVDTEPTIAEWSGRTPNSLNSYDAIVISDYNKGFLTYEHIEHIIRSVKCPVFIDTKKQDLSRFSADNVYLKINETEYKNRFSIPKNLIVTLGDRGAMLRQRDTEQFFETKSVEVMDVCGCGDTFLSALAVRYLMTYDIKDAILFANTAASITVQHRGNYAPTWKDLANGH